MTAPFEGRPAPIGAARTNDTMEDTDMTTTVINLKGRIHDYGPTLEHAPANLVYIGRRITMGGWRLPESIWANPYTTRKHRTQEEAVQRYARHLLDNPLMLGNVHKHHGYTLACWCAPLLCHGHVLAALADAPEAQHRALLDQFTDNPNAALPASTAA